MISHGAASISRPVVVLDGPGEARRTRALRGSAPLNLHARVEAPATGPVGDNQLRHEPIAEVPRRREVVCRVADFDVRHVEHARHRP
jgi:hypothetical protein